MEIRLISLRMSINLTQELFKKETHSQILVLYILKIYTLHQFCL